jgi:phosphatidylglycerol:prolipoprotein diacylglycerol transferase
MHPVLINIPVHRLAPLLSMPVNILITAVVTTLFYRLNRRKMTPNQAINATLFPGVVAFALTSVIQRTTSPWPLHTYGLLIALGFVVGIGLAVREARRTQFDEEAVLDFGFWALVSGLVGARLYFIAVNWKEYFVTRPWVRVDWLPFDVPAILAFWNGGLVFYGGALGAVAAFFWFARRRGLPYGSFSDIVIPSLPLGHALGRLGCFAAGCCWGDAAFHLQGTEVVSDFSFHAQFPSESLAYGSLLREVTPDVHGIMVRSGHTLPLYPTQLMEAFGETLIFGVLLLVRSRKAFHGQVAATYFLMYPLLRATLELFRGDAERGYIVDKVLSVGQFTSILVAVGSLLAMVFLVRKNRQRLAAGEPAAA